MYLTWDRPAMAFQILASELVHQIYNNLSTISDVINLSLTCRRFNHLLRSAHKLSTLFAAADREFGPIEDIKMLVTYNHTIPAHAKRDPIMSYALLRQVITVGIAGKRFEDIYPSVKWSEDFINRRALTLSEGRRVRQAIYRYWLYSEAFHNRMHPRTHRLLRGAVEDRCQLLRCWTNQDLVDIEDVRLILEDLLTSQICPTDGTVQKRIGADAVFIKWQYSQNSGSRFAPRPDSTRSLFYDAHEGAETKLPIAQARNMKMDGWGDEISQYHYVQSLLKLNPAQILWLHDHAVYKWEVEALIHEIGEDWFWNNGQTFSDTWVLVLRARGEDVESIRDGIFDAVQGIAVNSYIDGSLCE